jgi:hypothetical protein
MSAASTSVMDAALPGRRTKAGPTVTPIRIALFDQADFPIAMPVLQLLFARNGFLR